MRAASTIALALLATATFAIFIAPALSVAFDIFTGDRPALTLQPE